MSVVRIAIPVFRGKRRFHLLKGRPWSPVEHLILQALAKAPRTAATLAEQSALPKRLVIEALIRLMRADWVELSPQSAETLFRATAGGRDKAFLDELPNVPKAITRWMTFVIDRVTGMTFRGRELPIFERHIVEQRAERENIVWLEASADIFQEEPRAVFSALLEEDETIVDVDAAGDRLAERFALVLVRNAKPEGLPKAASLLEAAVLEAAKKSAALPRSESPVRVRASVAPIRADGAAPAPRQIAFQSSDLILGGEAHENALANLIKRARDRIIIHSTFVSATSLQSVMPTIMDAARRGVRVDILWGENEDKPEALVTRRLLADARAKLTAVSLDNLVAIHPFSTDSHAKILVADDGQTGRDVAIIGSCNWLYSGFNSFEASVRLREPDIVADVLDILSDLSRGRDGLWKPLTVDFAKLAREVRARPRLAGARAEGCLVLGAQHGHFVREARDNAARRIFVTSHRLGTAAKQAIIIPAVAAARDRRGIQTHVFFGRPSGQLTGVVAAEMTLDAGKDGVQVRSVHEPRLHAKVLAWDDDSVVITSQNWLSADPGPNSPLQEVGVYLKGGRIADNVITTFLNARQY
jgi:cardiolipin synthase